jgi:hypothetical protein
LCGDLLEGRIKNANHPGAIFKKIPEMKNSFRSAPPFKQKDDIKDVKEKLISSPF